MPFDRMVWLFTIMALTSVGLVWGLIDTRRIIEPPFLYATGMALILCPQLYPLAENPWRVPDEAFWVFNTMVVLCTIALYFGYLSRPRQLAGNLSRPRQINHERLFRLGFIAAAVGTAGAYKVHAMGTVLEWRGWPVYWITLAGFIVPGLTLMLLAYVHAPTSLRLIPVILFSIYPFLWVADAGRRSAALTLPLVYATPFLLYKRAFRVPRSVVCAGLALGLVIVYAFPVWRTHFKSHDYFQVVENRPLAEIFADTFVGDDEESHSEIGDGMIVAGARHQFGNYEWGVIGLYNQLIQNYVPGSLIGYDLKDSFRIGEAGRNDWVYEAYGIPVVAHTAKSGYTDLFSQFSYLGCIVPYWIGRGFRRAHRSAVDMQDGMAAIFLCFFIQLPASIPYASLTGNLTLQLPLIFFMLIAFRWCVPSSSSIHGER
jgi:hypothetical protein